MDEADVVRALGALAQETRLRIFRMLVVAGPRGMQPGQMAEALGTSPTALSFHLKELVNAGLASSEAVRPSHRWRVADFSVIECPLP